MRILVLANNDIGLYNFRAELLETLCSENKVFIALPDGEFITRLKAIGCEYIPFEFDRRGINPIADLSQIFRYKRLIKRIKADIVLTYTIKPNVYGGIACSMTRTPYIPNITGLGTSIENGGILGKISTSLYKTGLKNASCVFFQNAQNQQRFEDKGICSGRTRLIPGSGVNLKKNNYEEYPLNRGKIKLLFVGRIMRDKGIAELLEAMKRITVSYPNVLLDIVGGCDEDYSNALQEFENKGIIKYHGLQTDVHPFYKQAHCVILPSYHEGMANVMLEAASTGRPVITTNIPGCKETFDDNVTGFGCEPKDINSLVRAMELFLSLDHEEKKTMGIKGRKKMEREFNRNVIINAYIEEINRAYSTINPEKSEETPNEFV